MQKYSYPRSWGKLFERYIDTYLPDRKAELCKQADKEYRKLQKQKPDIGKGAMADTMNIWFCIVAFYEASDHVIDGKAFQTIHGWHIDRLRFLGKLIDGNRHQFPYIISKRSGNTGDEIRAQSGELAAYVLENIRGLDETVQYGNGMQRMDGMNRKTQQLTENQGKLNKLTGFNLALANTFILVFDIAMLLLSAHLYSKDITDFSGFIIPLIALMSSYGPVSALANLGTTLQSTVALGGRVLDIIEETPETEEITGKDDIAFSDAECKNVTFSYGGDVVLKDFSMKFPENKIVGVIGKSGSGKSTLLKLLMRFWKITSGTVNISGTNIENINTANLRDMESYMTQETQLFKDTIANNIRIGKLSATDAEVIAACKKASIHDFIMTLPNGYDTQVGELGETLSGGERQRIGLARAFLHDAPFMLLDEPTSNLDILNEAVILRSLKEESAGKTVVLVSHRASTMRIADESFFVENGRLS